MQRLFRKEVHPSGWKREATLTGRRYSLNCMETCSSRRAVQEITIPERRNLEGNYLWKAGLDKNPATLLGFPCYISEYAPNTFTASQYVAILGDFRFYWICDALNMQIQRLTELYAVSNQTGFIVRSETDGAPVLPEAFVRIQLAA